MKEYSIFLLEPDALLREAFLGVLEDKGYPVYSFANPWESFSFIKKIKFQIAVIDSELQGFNREELIREINNVHPLASIIVLTSEPEREELISFLNHDVASILLKPVNMAELDEALRKAVVKFKKNSEVQDLKAELEKTEEEREQLEISLKNTASRLPFALLSRSMVHEFKNILTTINISANFIKKSIAASSAKIDKHFSLIESSIQSADGLLLRLLGISKKREERFDLKDFVDTTIEMLDPELNRSGVRVVKNFDLRIPDLILDSSQLRQVMINIILNAKEAMVGGGQLTIKAYIEEDKNSSVVIDISDTGPGISDSEMDNLFLLNYTTKEEGNGIGLYISKKIIKSMGGSIKVESVLGKGCSFKIILPLKEKIEDISKALR
ncbi:MAG: ATP-binding protein [Candidatus Kaelpia aquatica]|nr:ATP-binding protein [Candidatus Kaelpia aquatica]